MYDVCEPTLVTPTENAGNLRHPACGDIQTGRTAYAVLGRAASRVVRPRRDAILPGQRQQWENKFPLCHLSVGPMIHRRGGGHHHLTSSAGPIHLAEDRAAETAIPLEGAARSPDPHTWDGRLQAVAVPEEPQKPHPRPAGILSATNLAQVTLACHSEVELDAAAYCADRIIETVPPPTLASTGEPTENNELLRRIGKLTRELAALSAERDCPLSRDCRSSSRDRLSSSSDPHCSPRNRSSSPRFSRPYSRSPPRTMTNNLLVPPTLRRQGA
jgi:hypothetical protein